LARCRTLGVVSARRSDLTAGSTASIGARPTADSTASSPVDAATAAAEAIGREHLDMVNPSGWRGLYARFGHLLHELSKFGTVGAVAFVVDVTIFNVLLSKFGVETLTAGAISTAVSATVAFVGNRFWTWRDRERSGLHREYTLYFLLNAGGLLITLSVLALSHYGLGAIWPVFTGRIADNVAKNLFGTALGTFFRFWSYRRFVFRAVPVTEE
jgi:putative flippase GtrA